MGALERPVASPCISVCVVDPRGTGVCVGCGRTLGEIAAWIDMPDDARRDVLARLPGRLAALRSRPPADAGTRDEADDDA
jgi:predicted Fe-S protein YdhL (DUF1289 family)